MEMIGSVIDAPYLSVSPGDHSHWLTVGSAS